MNVRYMKEGLLKLKGFESCIIQLLKLMLYLMPLLDTAFDRCITGKTSTHLWEIKWNVTFTNIYNKRICMMPKIPRC